MMDKNMTDLLRTVAFLFGVAAGITLTMVVLLVISIFVDVNVGVAFALQILVGACIGGLSLWRTA